MDFGMAVREGDTAGAMMITRWEINHDRARPGGHINGEVSIVNAVVSLVDEDQRSTRAGHRHLGALAKHPIARGPFPRILPSHPTTHGNGSHHWKHPIAFACHDFARNAAIDSGILGVRSQR